MQLDISLLPQEAVNRENKCIIVLDILRASSTIVTAFEAGCKSVIPVASVEEARQLKDENPAMLLCGERNGLPPQGFDLGNSPVEYTAQTVSGKDIILTTSNGTRAILGAERNSTVLIGSFLNFNAVLEKALSMGRDILIQCAGTDGAFSLEDTFAAALFIDAFNRRVCNLNIGDGARWALYALKGMAPGANTSEFGKREIQTILRNSAHGKRLTAAGFDGDLTFCARKDTTGVVPHLNADKLIVNKSEKE